MTYFRKWFLWLFLIITKQICNCLYSCSWGTSLTLCLKHLQHKEQFEALADTVTSEWWLRTPQQPDSKDSEVACLSLSSFAQKLVWVWPFQKEKYPCPAPTCPATVPDTTLLWPSPPTISWLSKMVSQRFFLWEPQETVQNSSMGQMECHGGRRGKLWLRHLSMAKRESMSPAGQWPPVRQLEMGPWIKVPQEEDRSQFEH